MNEKKYSLIIYKNKIESFILEEISEYLQKGIIVYLFTSNEMDIKNISNKFILEALNNMFLFFIKIKDNNFKDGEKAIDGNILDKEFFDYICNDKTIEFNIEHYKIVHSSVDSNILIKSGAGTGKTTAMINRILFLKHINKYINLSQITLITFTNDAAIQMRERLVEKIESYYELTKNNIYLEWLDEVANMNIRTIHSFARDILDEKGEEFGFLKNFKITTFRYMKQRLIEKYIDKFKNSSNGKIYTRFKNIKQYKLVRIILSIMDKLDNFSIDVKAMTYECGFGNDEENFNIMLEFIIKNVYSELEQIKQDTNSWEVNDLIKKLPNLQFDSNINLDIKVLMVDEFQDTDRIQIDFIIWLIEVSNAKLFVVGDEKQSIYRFRGAEYTSFDQLKEKYSRISFDNIEEFSITRNYRTNQKLLSNIDEWFSNINKKVDKFNYNEEDRIYSLKNNEVNNEICVKNLELKVSKTNLIKEILCRKQENEEICVLVRTNSDVKEIKRLCDWEGIPCSISSTGDFFRCEAVRDLYIVIKALINKNDTKDMYSFFNTYYVGYDVNKKEIIRNLSENRNQINSYLKSILDSLGWKSYVARARIESPITLIEEIIDTMEPEVNYYKKMLRKFNKIEAKIMATEYKINLDHCLFLIRKNFSGNVATLNSIESYLRINIQTNDIESKKEIDKIYKKNFIKCMTVHKAKGLEYDYVILPVTSKHFISKGRRIDLIINRDLIDNVSVGYKISLDDGTEIINDVYIENKRFENEEIVGEETRLFYVALTRAKKELYIHKSDITSSYVNSWMTLIPEEGYNV